MDLTSAAGTRRRSSVSIFEMGQYFPLGTGESVMLGFFHYTILLTLVRQG